MGALKPTVSGIGFYLHKDFGAAEVGILSAQRISCGRDLDFIYATNSARPGSDFIHTKFEKGAPHSPNFFMGPVIIRIY